MAYPWIKLYTEMLHDPKFGRLSEHLQLVFVKLCLEAGEYDDERTGILPPPEDLAWILRMEDDTLLADLTALANVGMVTRENDTWRVTHFEARQGAMTSTERVAALRGRKQKEAYRAGDGGATQPGQPCNDDVTIRYMGCNDDVTNRCTDLDLDIDLEEEVEEEVDVDVASARRALLTLPPSQRRAVLAQQACEISAAYDLDQSWRDTQGGDIVDEDDDSEVVVVPVTETVTPKRANDHDGDNLMAYFMRNLERANGLIQSEAQADLYREMVADIAALPVDRQRPFVDSLFAEAALKTTGRVKPSWYRAVIDAALRDGRLPGERAPAAGPPKPALRLVTETWRNPYTGETETHRVAMPVTDGASHGNG